MSIILALDLGTTGNRAIAFDGSGSVVAQAYREFEQIFPQPGWVEHDPMVIWETVLSVMREVVDRVGVDAIRGVGITNQRETTIVWDRRTGKPVCNAIVWQCRRTAEMCRQFESSRQMIKEKTGLFLDAYFSATKIRWILDRVSDHEHLLFGTVDTWILWQLTDGQVHATDTSNASRTLLFNLRTLNYDDDLLRLFGVPRGMLPEVRESGGEFGVTDASLLGKAVPIVAVLGDQQAALFAQDGLKNTYGTGLFIVANTGDKIPDAPRLVNTVAWTFSGKTTYALEGSVFVGGSLIQWLRDGLGIIDSSEETAGLALSVPDSGGVVVVPALVGLGAPHWKPDVRGQISGLTRGTTRAHLVRAALESLAFQTRDVVDVLPLKYAKLCVDGGASRNDFLMQFQADVLGMPVERPVVTETTAFGVAGLAGIVCGVWSLEAFRKVRQVDRVFSPTLSRDEEYEQWKGVVGRLVG